MGEPALRLELSIRLRFLLALRRAASACNANFFPCSVSISVPRIDHVVVAAMNAVVVMCAPPRTGRAFVLMLARLAFFVEPNNATWLTELVLVAAIVAVYGISCSVITIPAIAKAIIAGNCIRARHPTGAGANGTRA